LLKWHDEGELPYTTLVRPLPHGDAVVRKTEHWLKENFRDTNAIQRAIDNAGIPERTFKRRFKAATGVSLINYLQNLRVEHGKELLEETHIPVEEISELTGYADASFFRRLFKRLVGLNPKAYRRMFAGASRSSQM
jgi:transcriptional regulator GlxA family with amidase domain